MVFSVEIWRTLYRIQAIPGDPQHLQRGPNQLDNWVRHSPQATFSKDLSPRYSDVRLIRHMEVLICDNNIRQEDQHALWGPLRHTLPIA